MTGLELGKNMKYNSVQTSKQQNKTKNYKPEVKTSMGENQQT